MEYRLEHVCIRVVNLEKSLEFYTKALGLKEMERKNFSNHQVMEVYLSDENEEFEIKLAHDYTQRKIYKIGDGLSHFALTVQDLENSYNTHKKMGYRVSPLKYIPGEKSICYFVTDPDGYKIKIIRG